MGGFTENCIHPRQEQSTENQGADSDLTGALMLSPTYCFYVGDKRVRYDYFVISEPIDIPADFAENNRIEAIEIV